MRPCPQDLRCLPACPFVFQGSELCLVKCKVVPHAITPLSIPYVDTILFFMLLQFVPYLGRVAPQGDLANWGRGQLTAQMSDWLVLVT